MSKSMTADVSLATVGHPTVKRELLTRFVFLAGRGGKGGGREGWRGEGGRGREGEGGSGEGRARKNRRVEVPKAFGKVGSGGQIFVPDC